MEPEKLPTSSAGGDKCKPYTQISLCLLRGPSTEQPVVSQVFDPTVVFTASLPHWKKVLHVNEQGFAPPPKSTNPVANCTRDSRCSPTCISGQ